MIAEIKIIPCLQDNYSYLITLKNSKAAIIVDACEFDAIEATLQKAKLLPCDLLLTHHHHDHTGGLKHLLESYPALQVHAHQEMKSFLAPEDAARFKFYSVLQDAPQEVKIADLDFTLFHLPGHAQSSIGFLNATDFWLGDVLFKAGCGRVFGGLDDYKKLWQSLKIIKRLNTSIRLYSGHDLALSNLKFAQAVEPKNQLIAGQLADAAGGAASFDPISDLALELKINPFLKTDRPDFQKTVQDFLKKMGYHSELTQLLNASASDQDFLTFLVLRKIKSSWR